MRFSIKIEEIKANVICPLCTQGFSLSPRDKEDLEVFGYTLKLCPNCSQYIIIYYEK